MTKTNDKKSLGWLYGLITLGYALSFSFGSTRIGRLDSWNSLFLAGMGLFSVGLIIRVSALLTLKQFFTYTVGALEHQKVIDIGLYKLIRHPGYLGQLLIFLGISLSISNWISILTMMIPVCLGYFNRMNVEEKFMRDQFGDEYSRYQQRTKRIIPFVY
jgi:protein-S-isoprenylcysteine O-methyltransferase Ste14